MKVLLVSDFYPPVRGGLEGHVRALARHLVRLGHRVHVATLTRAPVDDPGVAVTSLPSLARLLPHQDATRPFHPPLPDPVTRAGLRRLLESFRPDVVHAHSWLGVSLPPESRSRLLITAHDYALVCQLHTLMQWGSTACDGPGAVKCMRCAGGVYGYAKSVPLTPGTVVGRHLMSPREIIAVSAAVAERLAPFMDVPIAVVPNFVAERPEAVPLPPLPERYVAYAGATTTVKGMSTLLEVWRDSPPAVPLVVASAHGRVDDIPPGVTVVRLQPGQIPEFLRRAEACVVPSIWHDPAPTVVLEALREGTPVVASRVGGIPDVVRDEYNGLLVQPGDPTELAHALRRVTTDPQLRAGLATRAYASHADFGADVIVPKIVEIYERVRRAADERDLPTRAP